MHLDLMHDTRTQMPDIQPAVKSLRIWHCKYRTLGPVSRLENLKVLVVATFPDDSFMLLRSLRDLQYLRILHMPKVHDLSPLAELRCLETLSLETTPGWDASGKVTTV